MSDLLKTFLETSCGLRADELPKSVMGRLTAIDDAMQARLRKASEAKAAMKDSRITVTAIANDIGVTRKTIYNNLILLEYIQAGERQQRADCATSADASKLKRKNEELSEQLEKMLRRDAQAEELKAEIDNLAKALKGKDALIASLQSSNDRLRRDLADARSKIPPKRGNVIEFDPGGNAD